MAETRRQKRNQKLREARDESKEFEKQAMANERRAARAEKKLQERGAIIRDIDDMISVGTPPEWHEELQLEEEHEKIPINKEQFEKLCSMFCTGDEIAGWFYCSQWTINYWCKKTYGETFSEVYAKLSMRGNISLRRLMLHHAARNAVMSIFLAKNYLGMKDNPDDDANKENIRLLMEIKNAMQEVAKSPVIDTDAGVVYDAEYTEAHEEDTSPIGKPVEVDENAD